MQPSTGPWGPPPRRAVGSCCARSYAEERAEGLRKGFEGARARAVPDRRELACLPGVLRAAGVDRHARRAADQRHLRACLDVREDARRPHAGRRGGRLGRGLVGQGVDLRAVQGRAQAPPGPAQGAVAAPDAAGRGVRVHERAGRGLRGRRRDRLDDEAGARARDPGDGGLGRPRRLPARRGRRAGDDDLAGRHRHQGLRPRGRDRALRGAAGARHRPDRAQGRHLGQHPRRPGDRRQDGRAAPAGVRLAGGGAGERGQGLRRQAQAEPDRARRGRAYLEAARHRGHSTSTSRWTSTS